MIMYKTTILFGALLIITGLAGYLGTGSEHKSALIPAAFGLVILICGLLAANESRRMMAMHIAVLIGLLGAIGSAYSLYKVYFNNASSDDSFIDTLLASTRDIFKQASYGDAAVISKLVTSILCAVFVGLCIRSFIAARKARELAEQTEEESAPTESIGSDQE